MMNWLKVATIKSRHFRFRVFSVLVLLSLLLLPAGSVSAVTATRTGHAACLDVLNNVTYPYRSPENPDNQETSLRARADEGELTAITFWYTNNASAAIQGDWSSVGASVETTLSGYDIWMASIPALAGNVWYKIAYTDAGETLWQTVSGLPAALSTSDGGWGVSSTSLEYQAPCSVTVNNTFNSGTTGWGVTAFDTIAGGWAAVALSGTVDVQAGDGTYSEDVNVNKTLTTLSVLESLTLDGDLTINAGTFSAPTATLYLTGNLTNNVNHAFHANFGNLEMNGSSPQYIGGNRVIVFHDLTINNHHGLTASTGVQIESEGSLTLENGVLTVTSQFFTLGASAEVYGSFDTDHMIVPKGKNLCRAYEPNGSDQNINYIFPVGEVTDTVEYSPLWINITSGGFGPPSGVCMGVYDAPHPNNNGIPRLTRYWTVVMTAVSNPTATVTFQYTDADVEGSPESEILPIQWNSDSTWTFGADPVDPDTNTGVMVVNSFSDFTGGTEPTSTVMASLDATPQVGSILVTWETLTETNQLGFNVLRSLTSTEMGTAINSELIPPENPSPQGGTYEFIDDTAEAGVTYYYTIDSVNTDNLHEYFGPVSAAWWHEIYLPVVVR